MTVNLYQVLINQSSNCMCHHTLENKIPSTAEVFATASRTWVISRYNELIPNHYGLFFKAQSVGFCRAGNGDSWFPMQCTTWTSPDGEDKAEDGTGPFGAPDLTPAQALEPKLPCKSCSGQCVMLCQLWPCHFLETVGDGWEKSWAPVKLMAELP